MIVYLKTADGLSDFDLVSMQSDETIIAKERTFSSIHDDFPKTLIHGTGRSWRLDIPSLSPVFQPIDMCIESSLL